MTTVSRKAGPRRRRNAVDQIVGGEELRSLLSWRGAVDAIATAVSGEPDPQGEPPRTIVDAGGAQLLLMPAVSDDVLGAKVITVAPDNPAQGLSRVQGVYVLFDRATSAPVALFDGDALTLRRTPAVTVAVAERILPEDARRLMVFGTGPQARAHIEAMLTVRPFDEVLVVGRAAGAAERLIDALGSLGAEVSPATRDDVGSADAVVCATSSASPVFDARMLRAGATVFAIGSHTPSRRELALELVERPHVFVEEREHARRENGNLLLGERERGAVYGDVVELRGLFCGEASRDPGRTAVYLGSGMGWQDLAVAAAAYRAVTAGAA